MTTKLMYGLLNGAAQIAWIVVIFTIFCGIIEIIRYTSIIYKFKNKYGNIKYFSLSKFKSNLYIWKYVIKIYNAIDFKFHKIGIRLSKSDELILVFNIAMNLIRFSSIIPYLEVTNNLDPLSCDFFNITFISNNKKILITFELNNNHLKIILVNDEERYTLVHLVDYKIPYISVDFYDDLQLMRVFNFDTPTIFSSFSSLHKEVLEYATDCLDDIATELSFLDLIKEPILNLKEQYSNALNKEIDTFMIYGFHFKESPNSEILCSINGAFIKYKENVPFYFGNFICKIIYDKNSKEIKYEFDNSNNYILIAIYINCINLYGKSEVINDLNKLKAMNDSIIM